MKALYRQYRPKTLAEVIGQEHITVPLQQALKYGKFSHAYLFAGPRGCGKTSVARIFAHEINHFPYELEDSYVDINEIDAASNTGVDNIRDLREKAVIAPTLGQYKVYIIDEVHMLSKSAFNALLKILEEPPAHVVFIMATTDPEKVPITITSRSQVYRFQLAQPEVMRAHLHRIAQQEQIKITDGALSLIVERGGGSFRDSLSLLDQISTLGSQEITADVIIDALRLPQHNATGRLLEAYHSRDLVQITETLQELFMVGTDPVLIATELIQAIISNPTPHFLPLLAELTTVTAPFADAKLLLALTKIFTPTALTTPAVNQKAKLIEESVIQPVRANKITGEDAGVAKPITKEVVAEDVGIPSESEAEAKNTVPTTVADSGDKATTEVATDAAGIADFSWSNYLEKIKTVSATIHTRLQRCPYVFQVDTLHLYPEKKMDHKIFTHTNNFAVLARQLAPLKLIIHSVDETPPATNMADTSTFSQISAIMGRVQEVKSNHDGEIPFE